LRADWCSRSAAGFPNAAHTQYNRTRRASIASAISSASGATSPTPAPPRPLPTVQAVVDAKLRSFLSSRFVNWDAVEAQLVAMGLLEKKGGSHEDAARRRRRCDVGRVRGMRSRGGKSIGEEIHFSHQSEGAVLLFCAYCVSCDVSCTYHTDERGDAAEAGESGAKSDSARSRRSSDEGDTAARLASLTARKPGESLPDLPRER